MDWRPYGPCCPRAAGDIEAAFCPECGHPFLRCMAFAECRGLVTPTGPCPVCVAPALLIDAGAVVQSKVGERVSVPLILRNNSPAGRPIWVNRIVMREGGADIPVALTWEQIESGAERHFTIDTSPLAEGGTYSLRTILVIGSRYKGLEEGYAFSSRVSLAVSGHDTQQIVTNISVTGTGGLVNAPLTTRPSAGPSASLADRVLLPLERAEKWELQGGGVRGYREPDLRVRRDAGFTFSGFRPADVPPDGTTLAISGRLACGRNSRQPDPAGTAMANDVCLRAYDPRTGALDEPATLAISRHHFDLVVVNDRLCVQARTTRGMELNGKALASGDVVPLVPGDRLVPISGRADKLALQVAFSASMGSVKQSNPPHTGDAMTANSAGFRLQASGFSKSPSAGDASAGSEAAGKFFLKPEA